MLDLAPGREMAVERGPDWLFVKIRGDDADGPETPSLASRLWSLLQEHLTYRLVLELDQVDVLGSRLIGQLVLVHDWICEHGGILRLCGLSPDNRRVLRQCRLEGLFPAYANRMDAVMCRNCAGTPRRPR